MFLGRLVILVVLFESYLAVPKQGFCPGLPLTGELRKYLLSSPIVLQARLHEVLPLQTRMLQTKELVFDLLVLTTTVIKKPSTMIQVPLRIIIQEFYTPASNTSSQKEESASSGSLPISRFGCLEFFQRNVKYTLMLADTKVTRTHNGQNLPVFALTGPLIPYNNKMNGKVFECLCESCTPPKINKFPPQIVTFGENFKATCIVEGNPLPEVMWYKGAYPVDVISNGRGNQVDIMQLNDHVLQAVFEIDSLILIDNGNYVCKASNSLGMVESVLKLRVVTNGKPPPGSEDKTDSTDFQPCAREDNYCLNGADCFVSKATPLMRMCKCIDGFMGDQCQFRTSGIEFSIKSTSKVSNFWLQIIIQSAIIAIIGVILITILLAIRCKDQRARKLRKLMRQLEGRANDVLCKSQYVQVNTIEPPLVPLSQDWLPSRQSPYQPRNHFPSPCIPHKPHYALLSRQNFSFSAVDSPSSYLSDRRFLDDCTDQARTTPVQRPQNFSVPIGQHRTNQ